MQKKGEEHLRLWTRTLIRPRFHMRLHRSYYKKKILNCNTNSSSRRLGGRLFTLPAKNVRINFLLKMSLRLALQFQKQNIQNAARTRTNG